MSKLQGLLFGLATVVLVVWSSYLFISPPNGSWLVPMHSNRVGIDNAIGWSLLVTGIVFILTNLLLAYFTWRYQDAPGATSAYWHDNTKLEITWTLVTAAILIVFLVNALNLWGGIITPAPAGAEVVEVTGQQFAWNVRYPGKDGVFGPTNPKLVDSDMGNFIGQDKSAPEAKDDVFSQNTLLLPAGKPVRVLIRSTDVIHSFFLPNFRVKQDAMPGMTVETWFIPKDEGDYEIACAEHCGLGHYKMRGSLFVVSEKAFAAAVASQDAFDAAVTELVKAHEKKQEQH
jgi:cytochrome c oxidase subunit II